jgi:hypothetical protein
MANTWSSIIFVTLTDGEYNDYWKSDVKSLLATDDVAGYRELHWCGQNRGRRDRLVQPGTLVAVRKNKKEMAFTIVGTVAEKTLLTPQHGKTAATYTLLVELYAEPWRIARAAGDRCVHWTVLRAVNIPTDGSYSPQGIYAA